jgi:CBS-domain-containing membrane protein
MPVLSQILDWLGTELDPGSLKDKLISGVGGAAGMLLVIGISQNVLHLSGAAMLIASMGASAVLVFGVPHGPLSQPWPVIAGHGISAIIGVLCARVIPDIVVAGSCAVGLSIIMMRVMKCIHPPGGATALTAVIGGPAVHGLGYSFVGMPVLLNAMVIVFAAVIVNYPFRWRRYPASLVKLPVASPDSRRVSHQDVMEALERLDTFVDITEDDLLRLHAQLARRVEERGKAQSVGSSLVK